MIDLAHRDDTQVEDRVVNKLRTGEQILQLQEQLKKKYDDDDAYDDDQTWNDIDSLDIQVADKETMEAVTNEDEELVDLFHKSLGTLPSGDETSSPTSIPSVRGNEGYKVESEIDDENDGVQSWRDAYGHRNGATAIMHVPCNGHYLTVTFRSLRVVANEIKQARSERTYYSGASVGVVVPK
jgi:hypothetical protein